jgi:hypothetical protein
MEVFEDLLALPYYKNHAATSGAVHNISKHEDAVKDIFIKRGLTETSLKTDQPAMSFVSQPNGTNNNPDFLVRFEGPKVFEFECKSVENGYKPIYNSGGISRNYIYIFSSKKMNKTTLYLGGDICSREQQGLIAELIMKQRLLEKEYNEKLRITDIYGRGVSYYTRPMIGQSGNSELTNYFTHVDRELCEKRVREYMISGELLEEREPPTRS